MSKTVREFGIRESTIRGFVKSINSVLDDDGNLPDELSSRRCLFRNQTGRYLEIDERLFDYVCSRQNSKLVVTRRDLAKQARIYAKESKIDDFKATDGYVSRFLNRYSMYNI